MRPLHLPSRPAGSSKRNSLRASNPVASSASPSVRLWGRIARKLGLPAQQTRIVELVLEGKEDKQIAREMNLRIPTVRTHLNRIFHRFGISGRVELILRIFAIVISVGSGVNGGDGV